MTTTRNAPADRRSIGRFCENAVADYLTAHGYTILAHGFAVKGGEIDLVAENEDTLVFVEVKGRTDGDQIRRFGRPSAAINTAKREHLYFTANEYIRRTGNRKKPRLDVAEVYMTPVEVLSDGALQKWMAISIRYYPSAFRGTV